MLFVGLSAGAVVVACSSDEITDTSSGTDSGTTDAGATATDASATDAADSSINVVSGDSSTPAYSVGGTVTGLEGSGLVLKNNGGDALSITASGTFTFAAALVDGTGYAVTIGAQPTKPSQTCDVKQDSGMITGANVSNVAVKCTTNTYAVSGTITGLVGKGLVLTNNDADDQTVDAPATTFSFPTKVASGASYAVAVKTQPSNDQTCTVTKETGAGKIDAADVGTVAVACTTRVCATTTENGAATLTCPDGQTIATLDFLSYGTPTGACGAFVINDACHAGATADITASCVGQATCTINATNGAFGDPCSGTFKSLAVQATCK